MENKKLTKKDLFKMVRGVVENSGVDNQVELLEFIDHELELLNNKAIRKANGETPTAKENAEILRLAMEHLAGVEKATISEILKDCEVIANYITIAGKNISNQKLSAVLNKGVEDKKLCKVAEKKVTYFSINQE